MEHISATNLLSGEKIQQLCDIYCGSVYDLHRNPIIATQSHKHLNIYDLNNKWNNPKLIFCYSCALKEFMNKLHYLTNPFVLVSHNEDTNITEEYLPIANNPLLIRWFAQNLQIKHPNVHFIPIGIANSMWEHGNIHNFLIVKEIDIVKEDKCYFFFDVSTNPRDRNECKQAIENKGLTFDVRRTPLEYLKELAKSKFAISPPGNGIDCHRIWECYYLNVIPILIRSPFTEIINDQLPCILLDKWDDFDYNAIMPTYSQHINKLQSKKYLYDFNYYKEQLLNYTLNSYSHVDCKNIPLDYKLSSILNKHNGFFIELGANNGLDQSNTAFLEFYKNWTGILVEPSLNAFNKCVENRPKSNCYNFACVSNDYINTEIRGDFDGSLMSSVEGQRQNSCSLVNVKTTTLEILLDIHNPSCIDFLSLDTEGYELNILKGLNLNKYRPTYMLIEIYSHDYNNIVNFLQENKYELICNFTNYNKDDNPGWDGTHNDYLFKDIYS